MGFILFHMICFVKYFLFKPIYKDDRRAQHDGNGSEQDGIAHADPAILFLPECIL